MAYTPPNSDSIDFVVTGSFTAPDADAIHFSLGSSGDVENVPAATFTLSGSSSEVSQFVEDVPGATFNPSGSSDISIQVSVPAATFTITASSSEVSGESENVPAATFTVAGSVDLSFTENVPAGTLTITASSDDILGVNENVPAATFNFTGSSDISIIENVPAATFSLSGVSAISFTENVAAATFILSGTSAEVIAFDNPAVTFNLSGSSESISFTTKYSIDRYFLIITGAADGLNDIEIPISSFQSNRRSGNPTYLSAVIPSVEYVDDIEARKNGTMRIEQGYEKNGHVLQREMIIETDIDIINYDIGGYKGSITLIGHTQVTYDPKTWTLDGTFTQSMRGGVLRYQLAKSYIFLNPGDTVTIEDNTFEIDTISYIISAIALPVVTLRAA